MLSEEDVANIKAIRFSDIIITSHSLEKDEVEEDVFRLPKSK